jgi:hypothetical protein
VLECWGKTGAVDALRKLARETYCDPRPPAQTAKQAADDHRSEEKTAWSARLNRRNNEGEEEKMDIMDILMFFLGIVGVKCTTDAAETVSGGCQHGEGPGMVAGTLIWSLFYICFLELSCVL